MLSVYHSSSYTIAAHAIIDDKDGFLNKSFQHTATAYSYLNNCGWVFQEIVLLKRVLYFYLARVLLKDHSSICTSSYYSINSLFQVLYKDYSLLKGLKPSLEDFFLVLALQYSIIEKYSRYQLMYKTNRLLAITGLADFYRQLDVDNHYLFEM